MALTCRIHAANRNKQICIEEIEQSKACRHAMTEQRPLPGRMSGGIMPPHLRADQIGSQMMFDVFTEPGNMPIRIGQPDKSQHLVSAPLRPAYVMERANLRNKRSCLDMLVRLHRHIIGLAILTKPWPRQIA